MRFADTLSDKERKKARKAAYLACVFGCISEVMIDSSAVIIMFFTLIDGGGMITMLSASAAGVFGALLLIPSSSIVVRFGLKRIVFYSCIIGCIGYLLIAAAPFFGMTAAKYIALAGCFIYSFQRGLYGAAWMPLLDNFLRPQDRAKFFGAMRFLYTVFIGVLFFAVGLVMQKNPPLIFLQTVIGVTGILLLGRYYWVSKFPVDPDAAVETPEIRKGLSIAIANKSLTAYSVYSCMIAVAFTSVLPLTYLYLKQHVMMNPGTVQLLSSIGMAGYAAGYFCYGHGLGKWQLKNLELFVHLIYIAAALLLFYVDKSFPYFTFFAGAVIFVQCFAISVFNCNNSSELLILPRPGNKTMAMAFVQTYNKIGEAVGRVGTSLILGHMILSPTWTLSDREYSYFQTLFLCSAVLLVILLIFLPTLPSFVSARKNRD